MHKLRVAALCASIILAAAAPALSQTASTPSSATRPAAATIAPLAADAAQSPNVTSPVVSSVVTIPEDTPFEIEINEKLSSGTNADGDRFSITVIEPVTLSNGVTIPSGYRGRGTIAHAQKRGFIGKAGELNVTFDYIRIGNDRVRLRATKNGTGKGSLGSAVALTVLFGPLGLLARGADLVIPQGFHVTAYADGDARITTPFSAPPQGDDL